MKTNKILIIFLLLAGGCSPKPASLEKVEKYNASLEEVKLDSASNLEIKELSADYKENRLNQLASAELRPIRDESAFKDLLNNERTLLNDWKPIRNFKPYRPQQTDSLVRIIRRCSAYDRGAPELERVPAYRSISALSLDYYQVMVPIAFHIITKTDGKGMLPEMDRKIAAQIDLLNSVYSRFHITFRLISTDVTINDRWFNSSSASPEMTNQLSKDPQHTMNVYSAGSPTLLGEATFPWYPENGTKKDYVLINFNTLPGGPTSFYGGQYNQGKTLIHETGHFLGLFHTFEGGANNKCNEPGNDGCNIGDQVDDTPSQKICYFEGCDLCPGGVDCDSCPAPGKDPIKNYMGYNPDNCMTEMTAGQRERLMRSIIKYRYYLVINPI